MGRGTRALAVGNPQPLMFLGGAMIRKRNIGTMAALGGVTAIAALLTGLPSAKADELSDLRANNELLQQRVEQLAQAGPGGGISAMGTNPVPGWARVGGGVPRSFLIPGTDTSLRVGGQITEIVDYWFTGGPANNSPQTTTVGATGQLESIPLDKTGQGHGGGGGGAGR